MNFRWKIPKLPGAFAAVMFLALALTIRANAQTPSLASWNDGPAKQAIVSFVKEVTDKSGTKYVEPRDRFATFDPKKLIMAILHGRALLRFPD
jgi:hypothetical protein